MIIYCSHHDLGGIHMNEYIIDGIKVRTTAVVVSVRRIPPKKSLLSRMKRAAQEFWQNNYFRSRTKTWFVVKAGEVACRSVGLHSLYLIFREYVVPYLPALYAAMKTIDWPSLVFCVDVGFALGLLTSVIIMWTKQQMKSWWSGRSAEK